MLHVLMTHANEGYSIFTNVINNMGFPIAMVCYFIWDKTKVTNQLSQAIENNNLVINKLITVLKHDELAQDGNDE